MVWNGCLIEIQYYVKLHTVGTGMVLRFVSPRMLKCSRETQSRLEVGPAKQNFMTMPCLRHGVWRGTGFVTRE